MDTQTLAKLKITNRQASLNRALSTLSKAVDATISASEDIGQHGWTFEAFETFNDMREKSRLISKWIDLSVQKAKLG